MATENKARVPALRFPEFEGEWEEKRLDDLMTFKNGVNADKDQYGRGRRYISVLDIISSEPITHDAILGQVDISQSEFERNEVQFGDILFQRSSEVREEAGQSNVYLDKEKSATFGGFVIRGRPICEFEPFYMSELLRTSSARREITSWAGGSTRYNIGQESLGRVSISLSASGSEQKKIAKFLRTVDLKIGALQEKEAALARFKRGLMQALFTRAVRFTRADGSNYPDWEEKRLGNVAEFLKGKGIAKSDIAEDGKLPCIRYGELYTDYTEIISTVHSRTNAPASELLLSKQYDVIIPASGEDRLDMARACCVLEKGVALGGDINIIRSDINGPFLAYYLSNAKRKEIARFAQGNSVVHLYGTQLKQVTVAVPHPDEQQKIVDALSAMDARLTAASEEIARLERFKAGLLQQMFV